MIKYYEHFVDMYYHFIATDKMCIRWCIDKPYNMHVSVLPVIKLSDDNLYVPLANFGADNFSIDSVDAAKKKTINLLRESYKLCTKFQRRYSLGKYDVYVLNTDYDNMVLDVSRTDGVTKIMIDMVEAVQSTVEPSMFWATAKMIHQKDEDDKNPEKIMKKSKVYKIDDTWTWFNETER